MLCDPSVASELESLGFGLAGDGPLVTADVGGRQPLESLELAAGSALLRRYRSGGVLAKLRGDRFRDCRRGLNEVRVSLELIAMNLRAPRPLACRARPHSKGGWRLDLLMQRVPQAQDLGKAWLSAEPLERRALESELGAYLAQLHAAGLLHRDLHWRNLLVQTGPMAQPYPLAQPGLLQQPGPLQQSGPSQRQRLWIADLDRAERVDRELTQSERLGQLARFWRALDKRRAAGEVAPGGRSALGVLTAYSSERHAGEACEVQIEERGQLWNSTHRKLAWRRRVARLRSRPRAEDLRV